MKGKTGKIEKSFAVRCCKCHWIFLPDEPGETICPGCYSLENERSKTPKKPTPKPSIPAKRCPVCGRRFVPRRSNTIICSPECSERSQWMILERDNFQCIYCCKTSYENRAELHLDHIIPRSKGGTDTADNLATACAKCNLGKSSNLIHIQDVILAEIAKRNKKRGIAPKQYIKV